MYVDKSLCPEFKLVNIKINELETKRGSAMKKFIFILLISLLATLAYAQTKTEAERLWELGDRAYKESRFYDAINYYEKALSYYPKNSLEAGGLYDEIGLCYMQLGEYTKAIKYFEISLDITKKFNKKDYLSDVYDHLGQAYAALEHFNKAEFYLVESLKLRKLLDDPYRLSEAYNNLGLLYWRMGHYGKALYNYEEALKLTRKNNYEQETGYILGNIGMVYMELGSYEKAKKYFEDSLKIREKYNNPQDLAIIYNNLGGLYLNAGIYEKSIYYFSKSYELSKKYGLLEDAALSLYNIAANYHWSGKYKEALKFYLESLKIFESINNHPYVAMTFENIAHLYLDLKDYGNAKLYFDKTEKVREKISERFNLGIVELYLSTKDYQKASEIFQKAPDGPEQSPFYRLQLYTQLGILQLNTNNYINSAKNFLKAIDLSEQIREKLTDRINIFRAGIYGGLIRPYRGIISALMEAEQKNLALPVEFKKFGNTLSSSAFYFSELTKARTLLEAMAGAKRKTEYAEIPRDLKEKENALLQELSYLDSRWEEALKKSEQAVKELEARRQGVKKQLDALIDILRKNYPRYAALHYPLPVKAEDLPLKNDEVLLEYAVTDEATYLFIVRKGGVKRLIKIPVKKEALEETAKAFIEPMNLKKPDKFSIKDAKKLYDILLSEALKEIKDNEKIIIVPDGILGLLPFEALIIKEGTGIKDSIYVADRYTVSYYQSATILALNRMLKTPEPEKPLFAVGNPVYSPEDPRYLAWKQGKRDTYLASSNQYAFRGLAIKAKWGAVTEDDRANRIEFPPLPETEEEVRGIAKIIGVKPEPPEILLSVMANEANVKKAGLEKYRYLHFATHASLPGMIQGVNEPFILLGQVENHGEDGFLTLSEVAGMRLNADMVVLSACVTGLGKEVEGEGVVNFARAFQQAGAKTVVVSLWEVASEPAVDYMKTFYSHLKSGKSKAEALKLTRTQIKAKYPSPFYWAVFILHGEG